MKMSLWICLTVVLMLASCGFAQELSGPGLTPDNPFYRLDRFVERLQLFMVRDRVARVRLHLKFAEERLAEADNMVGKGKVELAEKLMREHEKEMNETDEEMEKAEIEGRNITELAEHVSNVSFRHISVLMRLLDNEATGQSTREG